MSSEEKKHREDICPGKKLSRPELQSALDRLGSDEAPEYWRSLEELARTPEFLEQLHREFPKGASEWLDPVSRRGFMKLMGASLALAGMTACVKQPLEPILPYVRQPEEIIPGKPMFYASAMTMGGIGLPVLVQSNMGRPSKVDGNPQHPAVLGGSDVFMQASVLTMYDPDRCSTHFYHGQIRPWPSAVAGLRSAAAAQKLTGGTGIRLLTGSCSSPTVAAQMAAVLKAYPQARWYQWDPVHRDNVYAGAALAFGQPVETQYKFSEADIILSLDAAFLSGGFPGTHLYTREFALRRRPDPAIRPFATGDDQVIKDARPMSRFYMLETSPTNTGAKADHHLPLTTADFENYARIIALQLGVNIASGQLATANEGSPNFELRAGPNMRWIATLVKELQSHRGTSLVIAGEQASPEIHALAHAMNEALGNVGKTVFYTDPVLVNPGNQLNGMKELAADMHAGKVDLLIMSGVNPVYDAPADLNFSAALDKVAAKIHHGIYANETAVRCDWQISGTHYLEEWSDVRAKDGTISIVQPLIAPLYEGKSLHELLTALVADNPLTSGYDTVRGYWQSQVGPPTGAQRSLGTEHSGPDFEAWWRRAVHDGFVANSAFPARTMAAKAASFSAPLESPPTDQSPEIIFRPDPSIWGGEFSNNAWLQEIAKPLNKVVWDNPAMMCPAMAKRLNISQGDVVEFGSQGQKTRCAIWVQPGHPDRAISVFFGYGRERAGRAGNGFGFNVYQLRTTTAPWVASARIKNTGETYKLITTQGFQSMEGRPQVREATLEEFHKNPRFVHEKEEAPPPELTLYPNFKYTGYAWGMAIDMNACVGCNACMVACQSENNVPVVGKMEVARGRHMHWLRVDTYYHGDADNPRKLFQPVPCQQCENAPCELVCPVGATVHSTEGLNDMVYNRCVGTRYCSNNCPYKVRRFNFMLFQDWTIPQYKMMRNPEVSVRSRGVMEKCTYCVQRITKGRITAEEQNRLVRDGEIRPACQQACPADAIVFGNINDDSRVAKLKEMPLNYGLLEDLNTRPRTTYLAIVNNPNPELPVPPGEES
jgi:MoCo/4Fe-4S cofactor protein with predicted Tat translocation signal